MAVTGSVETGARPALDFVGELGQQLRVDSIRCSTTAGSGHPTSSMSAADLIAVLLLGTCATTGPSRRCQQRPPDLLEGPRLAAVYAMFKAVGAISDEELMTYRKFGSRLQGHPTPVMPWVDVATGSLGQGLPIAVGRRARRQVPRQAAVPRLGAVRRLASSPRARSGRHSTRPATTGSSNLTAIFDINRLGQRGRDRVRLGPGRLPPPGRGVRLPCRSSSTATT